MTPRATIIGSGPNGLSAAVTLARSGYAVRVLEAADAPGGSARSSPLTRPGFVHDVGSAVHPLALTSPWMRAFGLRERVAFAVPEASYAHPLSAGDAVVAWRDIARTAAGLGADGPRWRRLIDPLRRHLDEVVAVTGDTLWHAPAHPAALARLALGVAALGGPVTALRTARGQALWAGVAAHSTTPLPSAAAAGAGLLLAAHAHGPGGWPVPIGGAQAIVDALLHDLTAHGGVVECRMPVDDLASLEWGDPAAGDVLILAGSPVLAGTLPTTPARYRRALSRIRYGPGVAKVDLALSGPVPWLAPEVVAAPTVHLGGSAAAIAGAERRVRRGGIPPHPFVLLTQPGVVDATRAPAGGTVVWAYTHVPPHSGIDATEAVLAAIEPHAPGVRDLVVGAHSTSASTFAARNPAAPGGDGLGGLLSLERMLRRPTAGPVPWRTPMRGVYLGSAATPPGPGVHGMGGWYAARTVLQDAGRPHGLGDVFAGDGDARMGV